MNNQPGPSHQRGQPPDASPLIAAVAAIVEATLARQGILPPPQKQNPWKASQRRQRELGLSWRRIGWNRV